MGFAELRVGVAAGDGLVARFACGVVVVRPGGADDRLDALLEIVRRTCSDPGAPAAASLSRQLGGFLAEAGGAATPDFGVAARAEGGVGVLLHGAVQARVHAGDGTEELLHGRDATGLVERIVAPPFDSIDLAPEGAEALAVDARHNLELGTVGGRGVVLVAAPAVTAHAAEAAPSASVAPPAAGSETDAPLVDGIVCENDHFNHPLVRFCAMCGQGMFDRTPAYIRRPRPPLGALVLDTGVTLPLETDLVLGSDPALEDTTDGPVRHLRVWDHAGSVAPYHAEIRLVGWDVNVVDLGSAAGTHVWVPGTTYWQRLEANRPLTIPSGARVAVGSRTVTYTSNYL